MTASWKPPVRLSHVRLFALGITALLAFLLVLLFGVRMEAIAPATAIILPRDRHEVRAPLAGLIEPGWYDAQLVASGGAPLIPVRLDSLGNGMTDPAAGPIREVQRYRVLDQALGGVVSRETVRFHRLQPGDLLWPGQVVAAIDSDEWRRELDLLEQVIEPVSSEFPPSPTRVRREELRRKVAAAVMHVPGHSPHWLAVENAVARAQAVAAGDLIAVLTPCDPETGQPLALEAQLRIDEAHLAGVAPGELVRLSSNVHNHRLHGYAAAEIERIDPWGSAADGRREFSATAIIRETPFSLPLGSSCRAEIVIGRKLVYQIILEH